MKNIKSGFTLIELVVVMIILGILAGTAISKLGGSDETAYVSSMKADANAALAATNNVYAAEQDNATSVTVTSTDKKGAVSAPLKTVGGTVTTVTINASPFNTVSYTFNSGACNDGSNQTKIAVTNSKIPAAKTVTYDSCVDASIQSV